MADSNEAQLLSDLLRDIAREDARLDATHLEARVIEAVDASASATRPTFGATGAMRWAVAAAVAAAVLAPALFWLTDENPGEKVQLKVGTTEEVVGPTNTGGPAEAGDPAKAKGPARAEHSVPQIAKSIVTRSVPIVAPIVQSPIAPLPVAQASVIQPLEEFVPLMPMTERELTGPFQLVRVQMPRASLGTLRSPLEPPNELVEADVLLGEDGMARAIRVSKSGSVYPWRSR